MWYSVTVDVTDAMTSARTTRIDSPGRRPGNAQWTKLARDELCKGGDCDAPLPFSCCANCSGGSGGNECIGVHGAALPVAASGVEEGASADLVVDLDVDASSVDAVDAAACGTFVSSFWFVVCISECACVIFCSLLHSWCLSACYRS